VKFRRRYLLSPQWLERLYGVPYTSRKVTGCRKHMRFAEFARCFLFCRIGACCRSLVCAAVSGDFSISTRSTTSSGTWKNRVQFTGRDLPRQFSEDMPGRTSRGQVSFRASAGSATPSGGHLPYIAKYGHLGSLTASSPHQAAKMASGQIVSRGHLRGCANRCEEYVQMSETQAV
jgi:hypothetical protein